MLLHYNIIEVDTDCPLVEKIVEDIVSPERFFPGLFVPKDEINPLVEMSRHMVTLQCL